MHGLANALFGGAFEVTESGARVVPARQTGVGRDDAECVNGLRGTALDGAVVPGGSGEKR